MIEMNLFENEYFCAFFDYQGFDFNSQLYFKKNNTILHQIFEQNHQTMNLPFVEKLLKHQDIDPNIKNEEGNTFLHIFVRRTVSTEHILTTIRKYLQINKNIDLSIKNNLNHSISYLILKNEGPKKNVIDFLISTLDNHDLTGPDYLHLVLTIYNQSSNKYNLSQLLESLLKIKRLENKVCIDKTPRLLDYIGGDKLDEAFYRDSDKTFDENFSQSINIITCSKKNLIINFIKKQTATKIFLLSICLVDKYFMLREGTQDNIKRFFHIFGALHMDLQMILANRSVGLTKNIIKSDWINELIKDLLVKK
jgi:hypothetical protein